VKKIGIVGATGYTGVELLRLLSKHQNVEIHYVTSRANKGTRVDAMFPNLRGYIDLEFSDPSTEALAECDLVFFATPNGIAMNHTVELLNSETKVIDLAADFRIKNVDVWSKWYGMQHACPELLDEAIYGLPEINRSKLKNANLVANPGCYPTSVILGLLPLLENNLVELDNIIADTKSGVSGAGKQANIATLFSEMGESFKAYGVTGHRHQPEIAQILTQVSNQSVDLTFVPHLLPIIRGIHATIYSRTDADASKMQTLYEKRYANEPFVDVLTQGSHPETRNVKASNMCQIAIHKSSETSRLVVLSVIDNLVKGAAGQAIQNMNIMFGFQETESLDRPALLP